MELQIAKIFLGGCASVFLGMGILYVTIRCTAIVVGKFTKEDVSDGK